MKETLNGRFIEVLKHGVWGILGAKVGSYLKIKDEVKNLVTIKEYPDSNFYYNPGDTRFYKLMPEGFNPNVLPDKWCFKVTEENYKEFKHLRELPYIKGFITSGVYTGLNWGLWDTDSYGTEISFEMFKRFFLSDSKEEKINQQTEFTNDDYYIGEFSVELLNGISDINIPNIVKPLKQVNYNISQNEIKEIQVSLPQRIPKLVKEIELEKFNINI